MAAELTQETTPTTEQEIQRIVGDHPGNVLVIGSGAVLLVLILVAGLLVRRRASAAASRH